MSKKTLRGRDSKERVTITCQGCARTQTLRPWKLESCEGYYCEGCGFEPEGPGPGRILIHVFCAAGGFSGYRYEVPDEDQQAALNRAQALLQAYQERLKQMN